MKCVVADPVGGPENLKLIEAPTPELKPGEALIQLRYSGVNFIDIYHRTGLYKVPENPVRVGTEGAGMVSDPGDTDFKVGERVAFAMTRGTYAEFVAVPAPLLVRVPEGLDLRVVAAVMLQGMTAHYLTHSTYALGAKDWCLVHAAAGGTGSLIVQMARNAGARVIATAGSKQKADLAGSLGAQHVINYRQTPEFAAEVKRITGAGVHVVYDSVGAATFKQSLDCLRPRGYMVTFGNASGPVEPISPLTLTEKGSLFLTRPSLAAYIAERADLEWRASDLFRWIADGKLHVNIHHVYPLAESAQAQRDLESRATTGKLLIEI